MTITGYLNEKQAVLKNLSGLKQKLLGFNDMELDFGSLVLKIDQSIQNIEQDTFVIAMFGAFTDGKSTILKSIAKLDNIEISPEPLTNEVTLYQLDEEKFGKGFSIVDTPGLFSEHMLHTEKTKKYISEANIIIYTVDSVNPLKASHHPTIKWLLKDLGKLDSTIFVVNKMDAIADLEDEADYLHHSQIKKDVVKQIIREEISIEGDPAIVCVAADPFEQGLDFWAEQEENYQKLSRMNNLTSAIDQFVHDSKEQLLIKSGMSVIKDAINHSVTELSQVREHVKKNRELLKNQLFEIEGELVKFEKEITKKHLNITDEVINMREDILAYIASSSNMEDLQSKVTAKLGDEGYILNKKIETIIQKHTENLMETQRELIHNIEASIHFHDKIQDQLLQMGNKAGGKLIKALSGTSTKAISQTILKVRDMAKLPIKFKPWGAIKWAKALKTFGAVLSIALDSITGIADYVKEQKFEKKRTEIVSQVEDLFKAFLKSFTKEEYIAAYFPLLKMQQTFRMEKHEVLNAFNQTLNRLDQAIMEMENLDEM